LVEDKQIAH